MRIVGLDHVQLAMPPAEEEAARRFYGGTLGLVEVTKPAPLAARGGCWFKGGGAIVHLGVQSDFRPATKAHAAFLVENLDESRAVLARAEIETIEDDALAGTRRLYLHDPFGNRIELIQNGDGFSQRAPDATENRRS